MTKSLKSSAKTIAVAALFAVSAGGYALAADMPIKAPPPPKAVPFFFVNDTSVSFTWYFNATDPGVAGSSDTVPGGTAGQKNTFYRASGEIDHFDVWEYGTNLIHAEFDQYGKQDPNQGTVGAVGSREFFGFTRSTIGFNELTHSKWFTTPFTNDIGFESGVTAGVQDNFLSEQTTQYVVGVNLDLAIPKPLGLMLVGVLAHKEFTHNSFNTCGPSGFGAVNGPGAGLAPGAGGPAVAGGNTCAGGVGSFSGDRDFEWTWKVEIFNSVPLGGLLGSWADSAHFINILNITGPKGTGISQANCNAVGNGGACGGLGFLGSSAFTNNETKTEIFEDARVSVDTSKLFWGKPGIWDTYVGYRYWENKFGTNHSAPLFSLIAPGTSIESTAYVGTTYHFK
ncbi:MAG TPA: hypothetical protein VH206_01720 [Xanthobacteraceae bacterium]|nr:hypothetical protein [Xanthobacteraceae bacterium]